MFIALSHNVVEYNRCEGHVDGCDRINDDKNMILTFLLVMRRSKSQWMFN